MMTTMLWLDGIYVRADQVKSIRPRTGQGSIVELVDGTTRETNDLPDYLAMLCAPVIPAAPGFFELHSPALDCGEEVDAEEPHYCKDPIIAWRVKGWEVSPITTDGPDCNMLCPDGRVVGREEGAYEVYQSEKEWVDTIVMLSKQRAEREKTSDEPQPVAAE